MEEQPSSRPLASCSWGGVGWASVVKRQTGMSQGDKQTAPNSWGDSQFGTTHFRTFAMLQRPPDWPWAGVLPQHGSHHVVEAFRILGVAPSSTTNADLGAQQKTSHRHSFLMLRRIVADRRLEHMRALVQLPFIWMSSQDAAPMRGSMANGGAHSQQGARLPGHWTEHSTTNSVDNMAQFLLRNPSRAQRVQ